MHTSHWRLQIKGSVQYYRMDGLPLLDGILHAFSTRLGGCSEKPFDSLNLGFGSGDTPFRIESNRRLFLSGLGCETHRLRTVRQVHSSRVVILDAKDAEGRDIHEGDALATDVPGLLVGILTADCYPILMADPVRRVVAAVHAGWRGTAELIAVKTIAGMRENWGCEAVDLVAFVGPGIGSCCYQVGADVYESFVGTSPGAEAFFQSSPWAGHSSEPRWMLDLVTANRNQLEASGLLPERIHVLGSCTVCDAGRFFSYRRDGPATGRMLSVIGLDDHN